MTSSPAREGFEYGAFLSYVHQDQRWGKWLQRILETDRNRGVWSASRHRAAQSRGGWGPSFATAAVKQPYRSGAPMLRCGGNENASEYAQIK